MRFLLCYELLFSIDARRDKYVQAELVRIQHWQAFKFYRYKIIYRKSKVESQPRTPCCLNHSSRSARLTTLAYTRTPRALHPVRPAFSLPVFDESLNWTCCKADTPDGLACGDLDLMSDTRRGRRFR